PVGLIGHTKSDASETVRHLVEDVTGAPHSPDLAPADLGPADPAPVEPAPVEPGPGDPAAGGPGAAGPEDRAGS
ncbi:hypothetical protein QVL82_06835, partial [Cellulosimicrobium funkei]